MKFLLRAFAAATFLAVASPAFAQAICPVTGHSAEVKTGTTYTIGGTDLCRTVVFTSASSIAVTLPYPTTLTGYNFWVKVFAEGSGTVTVTSSAPPLGGSAPTINGASNIALATTHSATFYFGTDGNWYATYNGG
jgi:hypothetical protein